MKLRIFDIVLSLIGLLCSLPILMLLTILGLFDTGAPIFKQMRVGRYQRPFILIKFRTMKPDAPHIASHLADAATITRFGRFLRYTKLDELPQLWNVLLGDMSLIGPRPCLVSQKELIDERARRGVFDARPGITGLAQISGIDMSTPKLLAETDEKMLKNLNVKSYLKLLLLTASGNGSGDRVKSK